MNYFLLFKEFFRDIKKYFEYLFKKDCSNDIEPHYTIIAKDVNFPNATFTNGKKIPTTTVKTELTKVETIIGFSKVKPTLFEIVFETHKFKEARIVSLNRKHTKVNGDK